MTQRKRNGDNDLRGIDKKETERERETERCEGKIEMEINRKRNTATVIKRKESMTEN